MKLVLRCLGAAGIAVLAGSVAHPALSADAASLELGRQIFLQLSEPPCAMCHTLADAGSEGTVGPVLDVLKPNSEQVVAAVTNGIGVMPPYETLTKEQIEALALYVATAAGKK